MDNFLETMHPYILSEDSTLQNFALTTIAKAHLGNDTTFELALTANDKNTPVLGKNSILPYTMNYQIEQKGMRLLVNNIKKNDDNLIWFLSILTHCDPQLIENHYEEIKPFIPKKGLEPIENLLTLNHASTDKLLEEFDQILLEMEKQQFHNGALHTYSKHVIDRLIRKNGIDPEEVVRIIKKEMDNEFFSYKGILSVYAAGEMRIQSLVQDLSKLLLRVEEDVLLDEIGAALIKISSEEVITEVAQYALDPDAYFSPLSILGNIKSEYAIQTLLDLFDQAPDRTAKTLIAEALCKNLSVDAIPKVEALIEEGYDHFLLELEEDLYANCVINGVDHPKLQSWKALIDDRETQRKNREEELNKDFKSFNNRTIKAKIPDKSTKVGRNEPCPCGSGKKYKKCCGK